MGAELSEAIRRVLVEQGVPDGAVVLADGSLGPVRDWSWVLAGADGGTVVGGIGRNRFAEYAVLAKTSDAVALAIRLASSPLPRRVAALGPHEQEAGRVTALALVERTRNRGGASAPNELVVGDLLDTIGAETGHHLYALGTPFPARSQPPSDVGAPYLTFRVARGLPETVGEGIAAPWFEQPGGGAMVVLDRPIRWYVDQGWLEVTT